MSALNRIRSMLQNNPEAKYGFVVYRCTYSNNAKWERFMQYLTAQAKSALEVEDATDLFEKLDWNVQEDSGLEGIGVAGVRRQVSPSVSSICHLLLLGFWQCMLILANIQPLP